MRLAVAVTTAPRPRQTVAQSYRSFRDAGFTEPVLMLADGPPEPVPELPPPGPLDLRLNAPPLGGLKNWCRALETLLQESPARWLLVLEDDILWARGAAAALAKDLDTLDKIVKSAAHPGVGYLSLYLARKVSRNIESMRGRPLKPGMYSTTLAGECWGSQAYAIPRGTAERLLADPAFDDLRRNYVKNRNRDGIVSGRLAALGLKLYYRVPCLVSHELGSANSSLAEKPVQQALLSDYWTGAA